MREGNILTDSGDKNVDIFFEGGIALLTTTSIALSISTGYVPIKSNNYFPFILHRNSEKKNCNGAKNIPAHVTTKILFKLSHYDIFKSCKLLFKPRAWFTHQLGYTRQVVKKWNLPLYFSFFITTDFINPAFSLCFHGKSEFLKNS